MKTILFCCTLFYISFSQTKIKLLSLTAGFRVDSIEHQIITNTLRLYNKNAQEKLILQIDTVPTFFSLLTSIDSVPPDEYHTTLAMGTITNTPERRIKYDFSSVYIPSKEVLVARDRIPSFSITNISGKRVGYQRSTIEEKRIKRLKTIYPITPIGFVLYGDKGNALATGRVDFTLEDNIAVWDNPRFYIVHEFKDQAGKGISIMYPKGSVLRKKLDKYLRYYLKSPSFNALVERAFGKEIAHYFKAHLAR